MLVCGLLAQHLALRSASAKGRQQQLWCSGLTPKASAQILAVLTPLMLLAIIGLSVAPLCAFHEGW